MQCEPLSIDIIIIINYNVCNFLKAFHELLQSGILQQECVDVRPYVVDGVNYLARINNYT